MTFFSLYVFALSCVVAMYVHGVLSVFAVLCVCVC